MFCQHCGAELQTEDKFCPTCGKPNTEDTQPTPAQTPVQIPATPTEPIDPDAPTKGKGTAALVLGIISLSLIILPIPFIGSTGAPIASIVLAIISLVLARSFKKYPKVKGSGAARIGRLLSILGIIVSALKLVVAVTLTILGIVFSVFSTIFTAIVSVLTTVILPALGAFLSAVVPVVTALIGAIVSILGIVLPFLLQ